jgi:hypothetical protein
MHNATRIVTAALTAATLSLLAAVPLVAAAWRSPAEQPAASVSVNPLELMLQAGDLPGQQIQDLMTVF